MMKSTLVRTLAVAAILLQTTAFAVTQSQHNKNHCNFIPENNLRIPVGANLTGGIDEKTFNRVIDNISSFYEPIIKAKGGTLKVNRLWTDATVNASAQRSGSTWILNMYGGLARHSITTEDGFALVMCHEMGHQLGGFPSTGSIFGNNWASNEGQADYFATMKCFRRVYQSVDNSAVLSTMSVPEIVKTKCSDTFKSTTEINVCLRESMAGQVLANLLWALSNGQNSLTATAKPAFDTPDLSKVSSTNNAHPAAQCRLDTYFNGSICPVAYTEEFGAKDAITGACAMEKGDKLGYRPLCWFKPKN